MRNAVGRVFPLISANNGTPLPLCEGPNRRVIDGVIVTDYRREIPQAERGDG
jgi:hypothetical protein